MDEQSRMLETQQDADQDNAFGMFGPFPITGKPSQQQQDMFSGGPPHKEAFPGPASQLGSPETEGGPSKPKSRKRYDIPKTASCHVCGDLAAEHLHYGGIACYSCRAFFRRTVNSNRPILECSNNLECKIDKHTRKRCQFCRFEKCKAVGMRTTWVLTEDDKSKLALRRDMYPSDAPPSENLPISIKKELDCEQETAGPAGLGGAAGVPVKQRHASSPPNYFYGDQSEYSGRGPGYPAHSYPGPPSSYPSYMPPAIFPGPAINTMHVSLSGPAAAPGLSLTIETGGHGPGAGPGHGPGPGHAWPTKQEDSPAAGPSWKTLEVDQPAKKQKRHHQQSRTIFRCVSSENIEDGRSTVSSPSSESSQTTPYEAVSGNQVGPNFSLSEGPGEAGEQLPDEKLKAQVWKLGEEAFDRTGQPPGRHPLNRFTLQETLFVEQLTAIDERVRYQVPMDVSHGRSFLDCAVNGSPVSQMTIMHAYQTCIKRIVRFANSLQDFVELPPDDMQKLLVHNTVSIINIRIARWLHSKTDLETQMRLLATGRDLFREASEAGRLVPDPKEKQRVDYTDIFISPWCCDSSHEDRYEVLIEQISQLELDPTTVVLFSVMCLFHTAAGMELTARAGILSHQRKFSLLLQRYLLQSKGKEKTAEFFIKYEEALEKLHEMAEILINKRLIC